MSTTKRTVWSRNPWALPLLLALLIIGLILGVTFGSRLRKSAATATATPQRVTVVVTSASSAGTAPATATPGGKKGGSTPLPGATPVPTVPGIRLGMITHPQHEVQTIQNGAAATNTAYTYYLDPRQVVQQTLPKYGFTAPFQITSPAQVSPTPTPFTSPDNRPVINFVVAYKGQNYRVSVAQPAKKGPKGIWLIVTILKK